VPAAAARPGSAGCLWGSREAGRPRGRRSGGSPPPAARRAPAGPRAAPGPSARGPGPPRHRRSRPPLDRARRTAAPGQVTQTYSGPTANPKPRPAP
jgi:hypothetical protein